MQRYHAGSCTSAVKNSVVGGASARDASRADSSSLQPNFSVNTRRPSPLTPYELKCDKEPLNSRLGPPDFHPQTPNCPEETLTREYVQSGYRETVEGLEEAREISLSHVQIFTRPVVLKYKEAIRKCHRAINESCAKKRKAGQVYEVPLSGALLTKPGVFPEQRAAGEDFRRKWIEGLSQPHKRLRSLADQVPHGYRRKSLLEVLVWNNVPLLRATWFIKVTYLNQVRSGSAGISSGVLDNKTQFSRTEQWTKDIIEYLQYLLDEFVSRNASSHSNANTRDRSPQVVYAGGSLQQKRDSVSTVDSEEPSLQFKWWYVLGILQWHHAEGLLLPSLIIDWVLNQLQERELLGTLQMLLPIVYGVIESFLLSQTYVRTIVGIAVRFIQEPYQGGSDLVENSRRAYTTSALVEMLRYLILTVPDTFVALDCFPLPPSVVSHMVIDGSFLSKVGENNGKIKNGSREVGYFRKDKAHNGYFQSLSVNHVVSSIQKRSDTLVKAVRPGYPGFNVAKSVQELDKALRFGDVRMAYEFLFEDLCGRAVDEGWIFQISPCLRSSLKWIRTVSLPFICSVFFLCEWATCDFRDFRTAPGGLKFTGRKDFSQIYIAIRLLKLRIRDRQRRVHNLRNNSNSLDGRSKELSDLFQSPGPLHDIIVCWIDQHEALNKEGFQRLQLLIIELTRSGIFYPQAYVRQLIISGIMDMNEPLVSLHTQKRHYKVLKQLPGPLIQDALEEAQIAKVPVLLEAITIYTNERRLVLHGFISDHRKNPNSVNGSLSGKDGHRIADLEALKAAISVLLHLPNSFSTSADSGIDESQGSVKMIVGEGTPGCEECRRAKREKMSEERSSYLQGDSPNPLDDEETWLVGKGSKSLESFRVDSPLLKSAKQVSRGRQKIVRKTQSLAQLAAARIEGSQRASTRYVCDSRISCPHHISGSEREPHKTMDVSIGYTLEKLRLVEKRVLTVWLITLVRRLIEETENTASPRWRLGEDELSTILYVMDVSDDLVSAVRFLIWLLPKVSSSSSSAIHGGRTIPVMPRNVGSQTCEVGEAFVLSSLRRYENILVATDVIPETLSAIMHRAMTIMASNGRASGSIAILYARYLLKKYNNVASIVEWEKNFKATSDKRLVTELESGRSMDGEFGFPLGVPAGVDNLDDFLRQKISGVRVSRVGSSMREIVQRPLEDALQYFYGKERKLFSAGSVKGPPLEKWDDGYQIAQQIVRGLLDCIRKTGGAAQEGDPSLVSSSVSAIVNSIGLIIAKIPDFTASASSLKFAQRILQIHVTCLCLLKAALGECQRRVFEIALALEASSALTQDFAPLNAKLLNGILNNSAIVVLGRAAVSALVVGAVLHGVSSLERMVALFRLKEGLDFIQYVKSSRSYSNGNARSSGVFKVDHSMVEVSVHWFRVLIGNCRTVSEGLIVELLGEASIVALSRMQRTLPLSLVLPPAYSVFGFVKWRPFILNTSTSTDEELSHSLTLAILDAIKHLPFRDVCLRDSRGFYDLVVANSDDSDFAALLELNGPGMHLKTAAFVPLRARLFLNSILDCKLPHSISREEEAVAVHCTENEENILDKLVHVLDTLQPAKFHWQWIELRLLLNEQALIEKMGSAHDISIAETIRSLSPNPDKAGASDNENNFIEIILTRLLVRPDAASLFSEVVHLFRRSLEDSMLLQAKWFLGGNDVLFGKKSIRQRLINIAEKERLSMKAWFRKPRGWFYSNFDLSTISLEEGEVVEVGNDRQNSEGTERALVELVLPCIDQSSDESRNSFASDLIKQMNNIEQQINAVTRGSSKQARTVASGSEGSGNRGGNRKGMRGGSPGLARRSMGTADMVPPSPAALRASLSLRLHFLLRLLPIICADGEPSSRNMRHLLASVILRLLGSRVVYDDAEQSHYQMPSSSLKREVDSSMGASTADSVDLSGESLFDRLLLVLHGLLSSSRPSWMKSKPRSKSSADITKDWSVFDREVAENLQNELDRMQLPDMIRCRIQAAMPMLFPSVRWSISCQPPSVPPTALASLQPSISISGSHLGNSNVPQKNSFSLAKATNNVTRKNKPLPIHQDLDMDIDPWTLLEDGLGPGLSSSNTAVMGSTDPANLRASFWLKGTVRVRRTDLTYIGTVDDDS